MERYDISLSAVYRRSTNLFSFRHHLWPMNLNEHWMLAIASISLSEHRSFRNRSPSKINICILDSCEDGRDERKEMLFRLLKCYYQELILMFFHIHFKEFELNFISNVVERTQSNDYDCGTFLLDHMSQVLKSLCPVNFLPTVEIDSISPFYRELIQSRIKLFYEGRYNGNDLLGPRKKKSTGNLKDLMGKVLNKNCLTKLIQISKNVFTENFYTAGVRAVLSLPKDFDPEDIITWAKIQRSHANTEIRNSKKWNEFKNLLIKENLIESISIKTSTKGCIAFIKTFE